MFKPALPPKVRAKILMLHGYTQSGDLFLAKTRFLHESLEELVSTALFANHRPSFPGGVELFYPTASLRLRIPGRPDQAMTEVSYENTERFADTEEIDGWTWGYGDPDTEIIGLEQSLRSVLSLMKKYGPFIGIIGFSSGATIAMIIASLLEGHRHVQGFNFEILHPPLYFAVCYSGFMLSHETYRSFYYPKIQTPMLYFIGTFDTFVTECHTLKAVKRCSHSKVVYFSGAHYVPRSRETVRILTNFVSEALGWGENKEAPESDWIDI